MRKCIGKKGECENPGTVEDDNGKYRCDECQAELLAKVLGIYDEKRRFTL